MNVKLSIIPDRFQFQNIDEVRVRLMAFNSGEKESNPELGETTLFINGEESFSWSQTLGNGRHTEAWYRLPAGDSLSTSWDKLAPLLFKAAGSYSLELKMGDRTLQKLSVEVAP